MRANTYSPASRPQQLRIGGKTVSSAQTAWFGYCLCIALYAVVFNQWQAQPMPDYVWEAGVLVAAICLIPITLWYARGKQKLPMFELICISYLLSFSAPLYLQRNEITTKYQIFSWNTTYETLLMSAIGIAVMIIGYYFMVSFKPLNRFPKLDLPLDPTRTKTYFKIFIFCGLPLTVLTQLGVINAVGALSQFLIAQFSIAAVLLSYRVFNSNNKLGPIWNIILYASIGLAALSGLLTGMLESALMPLILLAMVRWHATRRLPITWVLTGLALFVVLNSAKMAYRSSAWPGPSLSISDKIGLWLDLGQGSVSTTTSPGSSSGPEETIRKSMSRFDQLHNFVMITDMTPGEVPFYGGKTYSYLLYGLIPRFLWPDKPTAQEGNDMFALDYGIMMPSQKGTSSFGMSQLAECYANFGFFGIVLIMPIQGMFFACIDELLNGPLSDGGRAIYVTIMFVFLNGIGGVASSVFLGVITSVVASSFILRLFCTGWKSRSRY